MKRLLGQTAFTFLTISALSLAGCGGGENQQTGADTTATDTSGMSGMGGEMTATANLQPTQGNNVSGTVTFTQVAEGVRVTANVTGLTPGQHGFHVHENGDCSAPDAASAGGHFAGQSTTHGAPESPSSQRHAGDLGNIEAGQNGEASYERVDSVLTLSGPNSIIGKAVIVHATADDLQSQPSGNAGARVACGVVESSGGMAGGMGGTSDTARTTR